MSEYAIGKGHAVGITISWETMCHVQSYFLAIPSCGTGALTTLWMKSCLGDSVGECSGLSEHPTLSTLNVVGIPLFATHNGITVANSSDCERLRPVRHMFDQLNPNFLPVNTSRAIFIKYGGGIYRKGWIIASTHHSVQRDVY